VHHHKIGETNEPSMYRITDNAVSCSGDILTFSCGFDLKFQPQVILVFKTKSPAIGIHVVFVIYLSPTKIYDQT